MNKFEIKNDFEKYKEIFLEQNAKLNLISKNDEKFLWEKHIYDSLAIKIFFDKYNVKNARILDIGCGGGFPCVPIAIEYPNFKIVGIDSIKKKIAAVDEIRKNLNLINLELFCGRVEAFEKKNFDIITSRAVAELSKICEYALPKLKKNGYFIAYKSQKTKEEIQNAQNILKKYKAKVVDIMEYTLPLEEVYKRNLVVISMV